MSKQISWLVINTIMYDKILVEFNSKRKIIPIKDIWLDGIDNIVFFDVKIHELTKRIIVENIK